MFKPVKLSTRLFLSFGLIIGFMLVLGIFALFEVNALNTLATKLYRHPLVVSQATRDINLNIHKIQNSIAAIALETNEVSLETTLKTIYAYEQNIDHNFNLLRERFLGNPAEVEAVVNTFRAWQPIRDQIVALLKQQKRPEAIALIHGSSEVQIGRLEEKIQVLTDFANNKANLFAEEIHYQLQQTWIGITAILLAVVFLGIVLAWVISRTLSQSINLAVYLAKEIAAGNLNNVIPSQDENEQRQNEIGQFLQALATMQVQLKERIGTIETAQHIAERASQEAQEHEQYWQTLVEEALIGLALFRRDGSLVNANTTFLNMIGYTAAEAFNQLTIWQLSPRQTEDNLVQLQMHYLETYGRYGPLEKEYLHKDGYSILTQEAGVLLDQQGERLIWVNVDDITGLKRLEMALRKSETHLQESLKIAQMGIWEGNLYTDEEQWSEETYQIVGIPKNTPVTHATFQTLIHPEDLERVEQTIEQAISKQQSYQLEFRINRPTGDIGYLQSFGRIYHDTVDKQWIIIGTVQDITARKQMEEALRDSEQRYRQLFMDSCAVKLLIAHEDLRIIEANPAACAFYGYPLETLKSLTIYDINPSSRKIIDQICWNVKRLVTNHFFTQHRLATGEIREVEVYASTITVQARPLNYTIVHDVTERKQAERALREREQLLTAILNAIQDTVLMITLDGTVITINPTGARRLNLTVAEIMGRCGWELVPPEVANRRKVVVENLVQTRTPQVHVDERTGLWFESYYYPVLDDQEQVSQVVVFARDITQRKQMEDTLRHSEREYRQLYEMLRDGFAKTNLEGRILQFNPAFQQMLGYSEAELYTLTYQNITVPSWHSLEERIIRAQVLTRGYSDTYEKEYIKKDGKILPVEITTYLISTTEGKPIGLSAFVRDITERKWVQQRLHEANAYYRSLIEASLDPLVTITPEGKISDLNAAMALVTGYSPEELVGSYFTDYFTEPTQARLILQQALYQGMVRDFELEIQHRDGYLLPVLCNASVYRDEAGKVIGIFAAARDIRRQKQVEGELRQAKETAEVANRAKSVFLANMSHELRTPLNAILGYTQILNRDKTLTSKQQEEIAIIHRSGEYLLTLINDVLDLSKIEADRLELYISDFNLEEFIQGINELFDLRAQQKGITYSYTALTPLPVGVHGDEKRLRQILLNLLSNAVKFTNQGEVSLKLSYYNGKMLFQIEDTGIGINPEDQQKIFLPFQQVGQPQHQVEGTGLGLPITKKLVDLMGGVLQVESLLGVGSVFWTELSLPTSQIIPSSLSNLPIIIGFQGPPYRILVIDDQRENRSVVIDLLTPLGFEMIEASNGEEGLRQVIMRRPDLVFLDMVMPHMTGFELATRIRSHPDLRRLPIIAMSATVFEQYQQQSLAVGCDDFLSKPIHAQILFNLLQKHLELEWIYESVTEDLRKSRLSEVSNHSSKEELVVGPTAAQAAILYDLAFTDELSKVIEQADKFAQQDATLVPFANQVRQLAKEFKEEQLSDLLEKYMKLDPQVLGNSLKILPHKDH